MKPEIKARWVEALRSGEYRKGNYALKTLDGRFDVTGVLCELAVADGIIPRAVRKDAKDDVFKGYLYGPEGNQSPTLICDDVVEWSGLGNQRGYRLAMKGDQGMSFEKLADYIEEKV